MAQFEFDHGLNPRLTRKIFKGSPEIALTHMVSSTNLTPEQAKRIRNLLDQRLKEGDK